MTRKCKKCQEPIKIEGRHLYCNPCKKQNKVELARVNYEKKTARDKAEWKNRYEARLVKRCAKCNIVVANIQKYCEKCKVIAKKERIANKTRKKVSKIKMPRYFFDDSAKWEAWDSY